MKIQRKKIRRILALLLAASLCLVSCRSQLIATTMELNKMEGTVSIHDGRQKEIEPKEQLNLYSGYQVETKKTSYAWINLDKVKLTKMDAESEIEIAKKRNDLEIMVHSGKLFFHITEPLEDNESLNIRTSSMIVGVRGTCGWVEASGQEQMKVYILEGTVGCQRDPSGRKDLDRKGLDKENSGEEGSSEKSSGGKSSDEEGSSQKDSSEENASVRDSGRKSSSTDNLREKRSVQNLLQRLLKDLPLPGLKDNASQDDLDASQNDLEISQDNSDISQKETDIGTEEDTENTALQDTSPETEKDTKKIKNETNNIYYVECMEEDEEVYVSAGNMAELTISPDGEEQIILSEFTVADIPDYVMEELLGDEDLQQKILEESGLDIGSTPGGNAGQDDEVSENEPDEGESPDNSTPESETGQASFFLKNTVYYGDPEKCRLTPAQARLFAETLELAIQEAETFQKPSSPDPFIQNILEGLGTKYPLRIDAAIFDAGDGIPGIFFSSGYANETYAELSNPEQEIVLAWDIKQTVFYLEKPDEVYHTGLNPLGLCDGYLLSSHLSSDGYYDGYVYPLIEGRISNASTMASCEPFAINNYQVDGLPASEESFEQWKNQWDVPMQVGYSYGEDGVYASHSCWGMVPVEEVLNVLNAYANQP